MAARPAIVQINLAPTLGGAEVFTAFMSRALAARGWPTCVLVRADADFWRDLVLTAMHNMSVTLGTVLPSILAMLTLVALGALLGWIAGTLVGRLAQALNLDQRSRTWGVTSALARAGIYRPPSQVLRRSRQPRRR